VLQKVGVDCSTLYAMKVLNKASACERITTEQHVFQKTGNSPFLVELRYAFRVDSLLYLVTDLFNGCDTCSLLKDWHSLPESDVTFYLSEIVLAVEKLHEMGIVHHDMKPANILIDRDGHIAVADYGLREVLSSENEGKCSVICGTTLYMASEIFRGEWYGMAVD